MTTACSRSPWRRVLLLLLVGFVLALGLGALAEGLLGHPWGERTAKTIAIGGGIGIALFFLRARRP